MNCGQTTAVQVANRCAAVFLAILLPGCVGATHSIERDGGADDVRLTRVNDHVQYYCPNDLAFLESLPDGTLTYTPGWKPRWLSPDGSRPKPRVEIQVDDCSTSTHDCIRLSPSEGASVRLFVPKSHSVDGVERLGDIEVFVTSVDDKRQTRAVDFLEKVGGEDRRISLLLDDKGVLAIEGLQFGGQPGSCFRLSEWGFYGRKTSAMW